MPLNSVTHLVFSFKGLRTINHLAGLEFLSKLHLDNNGICKIENIGHLKNLSLLDLSFNRIQKIEGLETLTKLDDLSLYSNQIKHVEGLDALQNLTSLSLGKNLLQNLDETSYLRRLKNLHLLTLEGNPFCKEQEYRNYVIGHLRDLRFLDHRIVDDGSLTAATEQYQDEMLEIKQKEADEEVLIKAAQAKAAQQELYREANLTIVDSLFDSMLSEDLEYSKMKEVPGLLEALDEYRQKYESNTEEVVGLILEQHVKKNEELHSWKSSVTMLLDKRDKESRLNVDIFNKLKKKLIHDKDLMNNCIQASHDSHTLKIDISEDQTLHIEEDKQKAINDNFQLEEIRRNRERVDDILSIMHEIEDQINDKLDQKLNSS